MNRGSSVHVPATARALGVVLLSAAAGTAVATTPAEWLANMERALGTRNYAGVFVHEQRGQTETLQIVHRAGNGRTDERIRSLDGSGREFIRRGGELTCYLPDQRLVVVEPARDGNLLLGELRRLDVTASGQYELRELAPTRVSGRNVRVLDVAPRDHYRYGYRLWIDAQSAMPLKSQLRAPRGEVLEQMVFTELRLPRQIADADLAPATDATGFRWARQPVSSVAAVNAIGDDAQNAWQSASLPPGFRMTLRAQQTLPGSSGPVTQWVFSDGLASVSVFVEQGAAGSAAPAGDAAAAATPAAAAAGDITQLGSSSAWSTTVQGYRVTAIGEVPPDTLRAIAGSMAPAAMAPAAMAPAAMAPGAGGRTVAPSGFAAPAPGLGGGAARRR